MATWKFRIAHDDGSDELKNVYLQNVVKFGLLVLIGMGALAIWALEYIAPTFFNYPYFKWALQIEDIARFWPLFVWCSGWAVFASLFHSATKHDGEIFLAEAGGYVLTGFWEELAYRWALIPWAMILLVCMNWVFSTVLGYVLGVVAIGGAIYFLMEDRRDIFGWFAAIACLAFAALCFWVGSTLDPIYWFVGDVLIPIANFATFRQLEPILIGGGTTLFVMGIFTANSWFRDGHKYQGLIGLINSWYVGMVLIYATVTYGLLTAIALHAIYDVTFAVTKYLKRRVFG